MSGTLKGKQGKAIARLGKEIQALKDSFPPGVLAIHYTDSDLKTIEFLISGPDDTAHAGGLFVTRLRLAANHPYSPPDFYMLTPNGRFATGQKICTTFTSFHPESWTPSYTLTTLIISFISFFAESSSGGVGILCHTQPAEKRRLAVESTAWCKRHFATKFPVLSRLPAGLQTPATILQAQQPQQQRHSKKAAGGSGAAIELDDECGFGERGGSNNVRAHRGGKGTAGMLEAERPAADAPSRKGGQAVVIDAEDAPGDAAPRRSKRHISLDDEVRVCKAAKHGAVNADGGQGQVELVGSSSADVIDLT